MAKPPRHSPQPGERVSTDVLDETAVGMRIHAEPAGSVMDNWTLIYNQSERRPPGDEHVGKLCMVRSKDGRNLSMRVYRTHGTDNWTLISVGGGVEENVEIEWVAPARMVLPR